MRLTIGSRSYQFEVVPDQLLDARGKPCASLCDHASRRILISSAVPWQVRTEIAALAVAEAWQHQAFYAGAIPFVGSVN